jgi:hypothetical protein
MHVVVFSSLVCSPNDGRSQYDEDVPTLLIIRLHCEGDERCSFGKWIALYNERIVHKLSLIVCLSSVHFIFCMD